MIDQKERLELFEKRFPYDSSKKESMPVKLQREKLKLIKERPEYNNKLAHFEENAVYCCSRKDIIIYVEVGRIKQ